MQLIYDNDTLPVTTTTNKTIMKFNFRRLHYAIIITNCNSYSAIANKQRIDVVLTDDNLKILSFKREMHENTLYENPEATTTILLPLNSFPNLKINTSFTLRK